MEQTTRDEALETCSELNQDQSSYSVIQSETASTVTELDEGEQNDARTDSLASTAQDVTDPDYDKTQRRERVGAERG